MAEQGGGDNIGARLFAQGMAGNAQAPDKDAKAEDLSDFINKLLDKTGSFITKFTGVNVNSFFNTGITKHVDLQQAALKVDNNIIMKNFDGQGGALANIVFGEVLTKAGLSIPGGGGAPDGGSSSGGGESGFASGSSMGGFEGGGGGGALAMGDGFISAMPSSVSYGGDMSFASLGELRPSVTPNTGAASGAGMDMG